MLPVEPFLVSSAAASAEGTVLYCTLRCVVLDCTKVEGGVWERGIEDEIDLVELVWWV